MSSPSSTATLESISSSLRTVTRAIQPYLDDRKVVEIMLNAGDPYIWVYRAAEGMSVTETTMSELEVVDFLRWVAAKSNTTITREKPTFYGTLPHWGCRVQGFMPPAVSGPAFVLRKPPPVVYPLADYVLRGVITERQCELLTQAVLARKNILVGGGTGSGKTTFVNALLRVLADTSERLIIAEDTPELQCMARNKLVLCTERNKYDTTAAIFDALRSRPDRIIIGELRDGTAHDLLKCWKTGHTGGIATLHADHTEGMLERICDLIEERIFPAPRRSVAATVHLCVHLSVDRASPTGCRLSGLDAVRGYDAAEQRWLLEPLS